MAETLYVEKLIKVKDKWVWTPEAVVVNTEDDFNIDELNLDAEFCRMGKLLIKYGDLAAELQAELKRKEEELKLTAARVAGTLRSTAERDGVKVTVDLIRDKVTVSDEYQQALAPLHVLRASAVKAEHWWRAAHTKAKMLESLAFKQSAELRKAY
jgi:hypothetical protein